jgi:osmoprotectant transport system ATP-binding protein
MARPELRRRIGYVFQGVGLFPHMSVGENIGITADLLGWPREHIRARTDELINLVDLPRDYLARMPDMLSGGQRQRIGVARALCTGPKIVLMDEPFGALDPVTRDGLGTAYRALHQRLSLTTVMVTHDVQEAALLADRIVVLAAGAVIADGTPRNLLAGSNPGTDELFSLPRRQAERIRVMMAEPPRAT